MRIFLLVIMFISFGFKPYKAIVSATNGETYKGSFASITERDTWVNSHKYKIGATLSYEDNTVILNAEITSNTNDKTAMKNIKTAFDSGTLTNVQLTRVVKYLFKRMQLGK